MRKPDEEYGPEDRAENLGREGEKFRFEVGRRFTG